MIQFATRAAPFPTASLAVALLFAMSALANLPRDTVAEDRFALPVSEAGLPGEGPLRRYDAYVKRWAELRAGWADRVQEDQGSVVFLGDSITQGWGASFRNQFPGVRLANRGIGGDTTRGMLIRIEEDVLALKPKAIVLLAGTNDIEVGIPAAAIGRNMQKLIAAIKRRDADVPIVLCRVFPSSAEMKRPRATIEQVNALFEAAVRGDSQITVLDTWTLFASPQGDADPRWFRDQLHLNPSGYQRWAAALRPLFATLGLSETEPDPFAPEAGYVSLFNGRDLTGWGFRPTAPRKPQGTKRPNAPVFVEIKEAEDFAGKRASSDGRYVALNGRLVVTTPTEGRRIQQLWTTREFDGDFILKLEFRATPNADSGVFIRKPQLQCRDYLLAGPYKQLKQYREGDWNELVITVKNGQARATCNGELLTDNLPVPPTGPIGLEGDRGQMEYRRIRIKELDDKQATALPGTPGAPAALTAEGRQEIRSEIQAVIDEGYYPGISILLIHRGEVVMREARGLADREARRPFGLDEFCWLASTGKIFTATLMAKLVDEGVLSFDEPISESFPQFAQLRLRTGAQPAQPVLIRHALSHTSGIPNDRWLEMQGIRATDPKYAGYFAPRTADQFVNACLQVGLVAEPGTEMWYGRPIDLCACVVQKKTGKSFIQLMDELVLKPLALRQTTLQPTADELQRLAPLYQATEPHRFSPDGKGLEVAGRQASLLPTAGGGVYTTLDDLGAMMQFHLNRGVHGGKQLIRSETLRQLYQPQPGTNGRYGLAFQLHTSKVNGQSQWFSHPGYSGPVAWVDFDRQLAGVLLMQSNTHNRTRHHQRIIDAIYRQIPPARQ